jgi:hypothetical protein
MVSPEERKLTDLENRLVSDLWTLQHDGEQATNNFAVSEILPTSQGAVQLTI